MEDFLKDYIWIYIYIYVIQILSQNLCYFKLILVAPPKYDQLAMADEEIMRLWIALTKTWSRHQMETFSALLALSAGNTPPRGQWRGALMFSLICTWTHGWGNNRDAGDLRRHCAQCDVTVTVTLRVQLWTCHACDHLFTMDHTILDGILCSTHCCAVLACWMAYVFGPFLSGVYTSSCFSVTCT